MNLGESAQIGEFGKRHHRVFRCFRPAYRLTYGIESCLFIIYAVLLEARA